jgi:shikimate kinase
MKGRGRGAAAVSFLNALFNGDGSAAGIELFARAEVELTPGSREEASDRLAPSLAEATAAAALEAWSEEPWTVRLEIRSEIPPSAGLKSSSAVATAVEHAVLDALGRSVDPVEVARLGARVARARGFSATGAFDDALASVLPGIHVTDNLDTRRLHESSAPTGVEVVLWVPRHAHGPSPLYRAQFRALAGSADRARLAALRGDWPEAMSRNSELVERAMGYDYESVRTAATKAGALATGVSGMGPAIALVAEPDRLGAVLGTLPKGGGQVIVTRFLRLPTRGDR